jgi:hypothetical protein
MFLVGSLFVSLPLHKNGRANYKFHFYTIEAGPPDDFGGRRPKAVSPETIIIWQAKVSPKQTPQIVPHIARGGCPLHVVSPGGARGVPQSIPREAWGYPGVPLGEDQGYPWGVCER